MTEKITIIGAGGGMGILFTKYFTDMGFEVTGHDIDNQKKVRASVKSDSLIGSILQPDYVLLCTPTKATPEIIRLISKEMKRGAFLIEISSEKSKTVPALAKTPSKINPICIHPMFGPGIKKIKGRNIICIPIKDAKKELATTKKLFPGANFVTIDSTEHDKKIALILGLTHLMNLAFANILARDETITLTEKMSGTTFKAQKIIAESILTETPELINTIISNPELRKYGEEFWRDIGRLLADSQEGKREDVMNYVKACQEKISKNVDLNKSSKKLSNMVNLIDK
ncbi:MAG TPA: prephenate dehydrogenase/arogenate dehydrogenase family protein [Candidatus Nitrosopelagicus sp.]|jgi:prephenate dehydrogenase|nr:prephenate dehydrogenase/arogenate dehydrogenase family protein [Candidatus Nitrosopelagicus sp.]HJN20194.1 prephenate dehydrogenase/arogenate dehydrogenase family protein [Candidatus Nitrosopelagicus sp.]